MKKVRLTIKRVLMQVNLISRIPDLVFCRFARPRPLLKLRSRRLGQVVGTCRNQLAARLPQFALNRRHGGPEPLLGQNRLRNPHLATWACCKHVAHTGLRTSTHRPWDQYLHTTRLCVERKDCRFGSHLCLSQDVGHLSVWAFPRSLGHVTGPC